MVRVDPRGQPPVEGTAVLPSSGRERAELLHRLCQRAEPGGGLFGRTGGSPRHPRSVRTVRGRTLPAAIPTELKTRAAWTLPRAARPFRVRPAPSRMASLKRAHAAPAGWRVGRLPETRPRRHTMGGGIDARRRGQPCSYPTVMTRLCDGHLPGLWYYRGRDTVTTKVRACRGRNRGSAGSPLRRADSAGGPSMRE